MQDKQKDQEHRKTYWRNLVEEHKRSDLTQKAFCAQRKISYPQFIYYNCRFKSEETLSVKNITTFTPVKVTGRESIATSYEIKISLPNGFQCALPSHLDSAYIKRLIEALVSC